MATTQIHDALPGEDLLAVEPELLQQVDAGWLQRLSLFTGRTLSDTALKNEQAYRAGRLATLGQAVTQGTVQGLALSADVTQADPVLTLSPGYGISATGQDVTLLRPLRAALSGLAVLDGDSGAYVADFGSFTPPAQAWAGIFLLQPVIAEAAGSAVDTGTGNIIVSGNLPASCDQDPTENAFGDSQIVDGARLVLVTWPTSAALTLPVATPATTWRNRLAYTIFDAEAALSVDEFLPWEFYGTPLALAGFDAASALLFADRSAVVRMGGLPRRRYLRPFGQKLAAVQPALANARVNQLAEQLGQDISPASPAGLVTSEFVLLPPAGVLPAYTMDFPNQKALWCPSNWNVTAAPIFAEELEGAIQRAMTAAPLDVTQNETIEILVPLPDAVYDPNILLTETPSPEFQAEVDAATLQRNIVLQHRFIIQREANALAPLLGRPAIDTQAGLTPDELAELTAASVFSPPDTEAFGTSMNVDGTYVADDLALLKQKAGASPFTVSANGVTVPLFNNDDMVDLQNNGIQHFIDRINAKLKRADDLLDLSFLTSQTDIYRYRQNVLNTIDASRLAVSPILANIASGDTAAATAVNIRDYLTSIQSATTQQVPVSTAPTTTTTTQKPTTRSTVSIRNTSPLSASTFLVTSRSAPTQRVAVIQQVEKETFTSASPAASTVRQTVQTTASTGSRPIDITQQAPIVGAQLSLRTLTIAERLAPSRAQEAMFYSVGNRIAILQLLADLEITIDDLPILVDNIPDKTSPFLVADLRVNADPARNAQLFQLINNPQIVAPANLNPDESSLFSTGVHVLEQHSQLMRGIEARIQQYRDFLTLAAAALARTRANMNGTQSLLIHLGNDLTQTRQNLAFVVALFADEQARVTNVNNQRTAVLSQYVSFITYVRPRTAVTEVKVPSRQLVPANVASPVPACLKQSLAIPPELREIVSLLREAPVRWFPPILVQLPKLERPSLLQNLAVSTQARASLQLALPVAASSAESTSGRFAPAISTIYSANHQTIRTLQAERASFNPAVLVSQSWSSQVDILSNVVALGDLLNASVVHPEITNAASRNLQQISSVATCLYTRVGQALPVDRLEWANFLLNGTVSLRYLGVLPGWNTQNYVDRQQMQLLVDWLYQQIDGSDSRAIALMDDVVATAILLASQAPVDDIIAGAIALRTTPVIGHPIRLTLPSDRVAHGMQVHLYSGGDLAARAVVSDLDGAGVTATITDIYKPNVSFLANDVAHFTALDQNAVAFRAFSI